MPDRKGRLLIDEGRLGIGTGEPKGQKPIQVRAEVLRHWEPAARQPAGFELGFAPIRDEGAGAIATGHGQWSDADLRRAMTVASQSKLASYRVEISPDGTISVIVAGASPKD